MVLATVQRLGKDGRGYELAWRLEACGAQDLASPSTWDAFLYPSLSSPLRMILLL